MRQAKKEMRPGPQYHFGPKQKNDEEGNRRPPKNSVPR